MLKSLTSEKNLHKFKIRASIVFNWLHVHPIHHSFNSFSFPAPKTIPPPLITTYGVLDLRHWKNSFEYISKKLDGLGIKYNNISLHRWRIAFLRKRQLFKHLNHISNQFKRREPTQNLQSLALNFDTNIRDW